MTAYNKLSGDHAFTLVLVCDRCGHAVHAADLEIADFALLWCIVTPTGWRGSERPVGPHCCPGCLNPPVPPI